MKFLTAAQQERFRAEGYLVVEGVLDPVRHIHPILAEYSTVLEGIAGQLHRNGEIKSTYADLSLIPRLVRVCAESGRNFPQHFDFSLPQNDIRRDTPIHLGPAIFHLLTNARLLDLVEDLIGPEIFSNPVQHIRFKLPAHAVQHGAANSLVTKVPWHQDNGVILPEADASTILTVWVPLTSATTRNSCLQVIPRSYERGLVTHCTNGGNLKIPDQLVPAECAVTLPMEPGSVLLITQHTMHSSLENQSDNDVRISMDLRYQPIGQPSGRPAFAAAGFNARSRANPRSVLRDPVVWAARWRGVREQLAGNKMVFNRWSVDAPTCA